MTDSQERLSDLIFEENERLRRLIYNLYLTFRLDYLPEQQLYDDICRNVAQYFHADSCVVSLIDYHFNPFTASSPLAPHLEIKGAFGSPCRLLRPCNVRERPNHSVPLDCDDPGIELFTLTLRVPKLYPSRCLYRTGTRTNLQTPAHHVWHNDNLYNTSRNIILAPLFLFDRTPDDDQLADGVLKVENRTPRLISAYSATAGRKDLFLSELWKLTALRPYLRALLADGTRPNPAGSPTQTAQSHSTFQASSALLHAASAYPDNEGWRRHYNERPLGRDYFDQLSRQASTLLRHDSSAGPILDRPAVRHLRLLCDDLSMLLDFVSEAEMFLQSLLRALRLAASLPPDPLEVTYAPSLFNVNNLLRAAVLDSSNSGDACPDKIAAFLHGLLYAPLISTEGRDSTDCPDASECVAALADRTLHKIFPEGVPDPNSIVDALRTHILAARKHLTQESDALRAGWAFTDRGCVILPVCALWRHEGSVGTSQGNCRIAAARTGGSD